MSGPETPRQGIVAFLVAFDDVIRHARSRGLRGDWSLLDRRLQAISQRVAEAAEDPDLIEQAGRLEIEVWLQTIGQELVEDKLHRVDDLIRRSRSVPESLLELLYPERAAARDQEVTLRGEAIEAELLWIAMACATQPTNALIRRAVVSLEQLERLKHPHVPSLEELEAAGTAISHALSAVLPPIARSVLVREVKVRWEAAVRAVPLSEIERDTAGQIERWPALQGWRPLWVVVRPVTNGPAARGRYFNTLQAEFEALHDARVLEDHRRDRIARIPEASRYDLSVVSGDSGQPHPELDAVLDELAAFEIDRADRERRAQVRLDQQAPVEGMRMLKGWLDMSGLMFKALTEESRARQLEEWTARARERLWADFKRQEGTRREELLMKAEALQASVSVAPARG